MSIVAAQLIPLAPPAAPSPDIRGIVPAQPYDIASVNLLWLAIGLAVVLLAALSYWYFFRRPRPQRRVPGLSPREVATRRLLELERQADALEPRLFGVEVCDILRAYIGAQYGLHPERQTSPEFLSSIVHASVFSGAEKSWLSEFLEQCDLLKFARHDAPDEARKKLLAQAREFLQPTPAPSLPEVLSPATQN